MRRINEIHANICPDGKVQLDEFAKDQYKKELIGNIVGRSFFFLSGASLVIFAGYISPHSFFAYLLFSPFVAGSLYLAFSGRPSISFEKKNVKIINDNIDNNWLLKIIKKHGSVLSNDRYSELCKKHHVLKIESFKVNNKKVLEIVTEGNRIYSVSQYAKLVNKKVEEDIDRLARRLAAVGL